MSRKLHIGGTQPAEGWEIFNISPGPYVDHVGDASDLSRFPSCSFDEIYASHVVEHFDYASELVMTLRGWNRVLSPLGKVYVSVPDLDILARLFIDQETSVADRFFVMRMIFGGHVDKHDYHHAGLNEEFLTKFLKDAGFGSIKRVPGFGLFKDSSGMMFRGKPISLNLLARKLVDIDAI